jgi:hypothetical protein
MHEVIVGRACSGCPIGRRIQMESLPSPGPALADGVLPSVP